jgi:hypothetical protein
MKIRLTPEISYIIGLWIHCKTEKGIGVRGDGETISNFAKSCLDLGIAVPGKLLYGENEIFFYNSMIRKFFDKIAGERTERFKYGNEYSSAYLAGLFDSFGSVEHGRVCIKNLDIFDKNLLDNLRMFPKDAGRFTIILKDRAFLKFISPYVKRNRRILESAKI